MRLLAVRRAGARTTVEDLGRSGFGHAGVPAGGAFDRLALVAANRLVGNPDDAAGLEVTLLGPELEYYGDGPLAAAAVGADFGATVIGASGGRELRPGTRVALASGDRLQLGAARDGARAWIAFAGGVQVPLVLGSRSTCAAGGFGGFEGRPLRAGDLLELTAAGGPVTLALAPAAAVAEGREAHPARLDPTVLRILAGPQLALFRNDALGLFESSLWVVSNDSNRVGVRLSALDPSVAQRLGGVAGIPPEGTTLGAIQVTPDGSAVVLGPDRPVTGGYAKPALVAEADVGEVARLRPGDRLRFQRIDLEEALALAAARREALRAPAGSR